MASESEQRREMLDARLRAQRARRARPGFITEVESILGYAPTLDEFLSAEATARLVENSLRSSSTPDVQRRMWSDGLGGEARATLLTVADALDHASAYWLHETAADLGAVLVRVAPMLRRAASDFQPGDYDLVLVDDEGASGLRFAWDHLPDHDEYELVSWGAFRTEP